MSIKSKLVHSKQATLIIMSILIPCSILLIGITINWAQQPDDKYESVRDSYRDKTAFEKCVERIKATNHKALPNFDLSVIPDAPQQASPTGDRGFHITRVTPTSEEIAKAQISKPTSLYGCKLKWWKWNKIKPRPFTSFISKNMAAGALALSIIFYIIAFTLVLYARCNNLGWKRLAIVASVIPSLFMGYYILNSTRNPELAGIVFAAIAGYIISVFAILGGQRLALWIKEGFNSSSH